MTGYLRQHWLALRDTLSAQVRAPVAFLLTASVIGITLALPAGVYLVIDNITRLSSGWQGAGRVSLFLKQELAGKAADKLADRLRRQPEIARVEVITPAQALEEFRRYSGFGDALSALDHNPLPTVLVVHPATAQQSPEHVDRLARELRRVNEIDQVIVDLDWVRRLHAWLQLAEQGVWLLSGFLGLAVLLIVGNTVRLAVLNRRDEIIVVKLIGGTNAFIRRPFLYTGVVQGLAGGLLAWLVLGFSLWVLADTIRDLSQLHHSQFSAAGLDMAGGGLLAGVGGLLGWLGSRLAVGRHLRSIEPT
jgi:cell division transport system permease protein